MFLYLATLSNVTGKVIWRDYQIQAIVIIELYNGLTKGRNETYSFILQK